MVWVRAAYQFLEVLESRLRAPLIGQSTSAARSLGGHPWQQAQANSRPATLKALRAVRRDCGSGLNRDSRRPADFTGSLTTYTEPLESCIIVSAVYGLTALLHTLPSDT